MFDIKKVLQMIVKAPTLFTYSIYVWGTKIDPHKMFITAVFQQILLGVLWAVYWTTPGSSFLGIGIFGCAFFFAMFLNYVVLLNCPRNKDYWHYILTGKVNENLQARMDMYQAQQQQSIEQQDVVMDLTQMTVEDYAEPEDVQTQTEEVVEDTPWQMSQEELENIAQKIIIDDVMETAQVEEKHETLEDLSQMLMSDAQEETIEEHIEETPKTAPSTEATVQNTVKAEPVIEVKKEEPPIEEKPIVTLDVATEDKMMDTLVATSSNADITEEDMPEIFIDTGAGLGVADDDEI